MKMKFKEPNCNSISSTVELRVLTPVEGKTELVIKSEGKLIIKINAFAKCLWIEGILKYFLIMKIKL